MRSQQQLHALTENHPLRLTRAKGHRVECVAGRVWITAYNEGGDIELTPGQKFIIPNHGLALVDALGTATVRMERPRSAANMLGAIVAAGKLRLRLQLQRARAAALALAGALGLAPRH